MKRVIMMTLLALPMVYTNAWKPIFIGHRGSDIGVENTREAYENGVDVYGVDGLECDVQVTKDGELVMCHDSKLDNYGQKGVIINDHTLAELQALTLKQKRTYLPTGKDSTYTGKICTFDEYLQVCSTKHVIPVIELKGAPGLTTGNMSKFSKLYNALKQYNLQDTCVIICFTQGVIEYIRTNYPTITCQRLWMETEITDELIDWCKQWGVNPSLDISYKYWDIHTVKRCKEAGLEVATWTINDAGTYKEFVTNRGCYMSTGDCIKKSAMAEGTTINWSQVARYAKAVKVNTADWPLPESPLDSLKADSVRFTIDRHEILLTRADTKGEGSWVMHDIDADKKPEIARAAGWVTGAQQTTAFTYTRIDASTIYMYEQCGDSIRAWFVGTGQAPFAATSMRLKQKEVSMLVGDTVYIEAIVEPENCTSTMTWTLSNTRNFKKQSLDNYRVMLVAKVLGDANIVAKIDGLKDTCTIHVVETLDAETTQAPNKKVARKILRNGQLYILRDGVLFDATGTKREDVTW